MSNYCKTFIDKQYGINSKDQLTKEGKLVITGALQVHNFFSVLCHTAACQGKRRTWLFRTHIFPSIRQTAPRFFHLSAKRRIDFSICAAAPRFFPSIRQTAPSFFHLSAKWRLDFSIYPPNGA